MIRANCRARFTADDFQFIVHTLSRSKKEAVSLAELLTDAEALDLVLDNEALLRELLAGNDHVAISPQFYFYILTRHALKDRSIECRELCDYIAALLEDFSRMTQLQLHGGHPYLSDLLLSLREASSASRFFLQAHIGNVALFISGIFHENVERRRQRGAPSLRFYEQIGSHSYHAAAGSSCLVADELRGVYADLAEGFHECRLALNRLSEELLHIDTPPELPLLA